MQSGAASISTYRIYLDGDNRQERFVVKNGTITPEQCELSFSYLDYKEGAQLKKLSNEQEQALSKPALKHLRYSPKRFIIKPKSFQYIALSYRRQINDTPAEHRTYLNIKCLAIAEQGEPGISLKPTIVHAVPLIIRTGKASDLSATLVFDQLKQQQNNISFRLTLQGERSVYGDIKVLNGNGDEVALLQRNVVIYPEMQYKDFNFTLPNLTSENMKIVFQETGDFSANKTFTLSLNGEL
ncbi:MAG: hypothetical protein ACI9ES_000559 [Oceanospirillaceae bacterium]|jgi:hypothetical protein